MLARVNILLPYTFTVPEGEQFPVYEYEMEGYGIRFYPPKRSERANSHTNAENITINEVNAFNADVLCIDFYKESFERAENSDHDPPLDLIKIVANDFLSRLRYVANAAHVKLIEFPNTSWSLSYLNDDGTDLPEEKGLMRWRGMRKFQFSFVALNKEIWEDIHKLEPHKPLPVWKSLLLDADSILPEIGPAVVLTFTALEVFISTILDELAESSELDDELWKWMNNRGYLKDPSIEERYDFLCSHFLGKSIKENNDLWESFKHLRKARNSFAHDGVAKLGGEPITEDKARGFIKRASEIIQFIKNELPEELRWTEFKHEIKLGFTQRLVANDDEQANN